MRNNCIKTVLAFFLSTLVILTTGCRNVDKYTDTSIQSTPGVALQDTLDCVVKSTKLRGEVVYNSSEVMIRTTGLLQHDDQDLMIEFVIQNKSETDYSVTCRKFSVNNKEIEGVLYCELFANSTVYTYIYITEYTLFSNKINTIEECSMRLSFVNIQNQYTDDGYSVSDKINLPILISENEWNIYTTAVVILTP